MHGEERISRIDVARPSAELDRMLTTGQGVKHHPKPVRNRLGVRHVRLAEVLEWGDWIRTIGVENTAGIPSTSI
jgi:hypothetical protein